MTTTIADLFDGWLLDLDGVVYIDDRALPGARQAVLTLRQRGSRILFMTNDPRSSRHEYAEKLTRLGIPAGPDDLVTAGWAAADFLASKRLTDRPVFVIGSTALRAEMERVGCRLVEGRDGMDAGVVVIGGYDGFDYAQLTIASIAARRGAYLVATARDATYPTADGPTPATGAILAAVETASGITATAVGKPEAFMYELARARMPERKRVVVVGDRLDVDVLGGHRAGLATILVRDPDRPNADPGPLHVAADYEVPSLAAVLRQAAT